MAGTRISYTIVDTMTGQTWSSADLRTVFSSQVQAIESYNNSRHARTPSYSAQTRYRIKAHKIEVAT